jgi:broad specificity phosphatase PhoE
MKTTLYLVHQATEADPQRPERLPKRRPSTSLDWRGTRQAQLTRDFLAVRSLDACYSSPSERAVRTARIIAEPHGLVPCILAGLDERAACAAGRDDSQTAHYLDADGVRHAVRFPAEESFAQLQERVAAAIDALLAHHEGHAVLVVAHRRAHLGYLARLLDMTAEQAEPVRLDTCGVSVVVRTGGRTTVATLNASFHLQGAAA